MDNTANRLKQRYASYKKALAALSGAVELAKTRQLSDLEKQGVIQAFEFTHELAWKLMKDFFEYQGETNIYGSKDATKLAFERGLIDNGDIWLEMITSRNLTLQTYDLDVLNDLCDKIIRRFYVGFKAFEQKFWVIIETDLTQKLHA